MTLAEKKLATKELIKESLIETNGIMLHAAKLSGLSIRTLRNYMIYFPELKEYKAEVAESNKDKEGYEEMLRRYPH